MIAPIDPSMVLGSDAAIGGVGSVAPTVVPATPATEGGSFGDTLSTAVKSLESTQTEAAQAATDLATGTATSPEAVVMAVERAKLSMQMASTIRTRGVEAINDILHTQV